MRTLKSVVLLACCCLARSTFAQKESLLIGPGDEVKVQVYDTPDLSESVRVTDAGDIPLILGGNIRLASLSTTEAAHAIEHVLVQAHIMYYPRVLVTVTQYATQNVTVFGQVAKPGAYSIETPRSVVDVLTLAGGLTELADRHVTIERHNSHRQIAYYVSNRASDLVEQPLLVNPGDKVIVPKAGIVYVLGDVGRPGGYPMTNAESSLTVLQAVAMSGGTTTSAVPSNTKLIRSTGDGAYSTTRLPLSAMQKGKKPDMRLQADDIIYVPFSYLRNAALGIGNIAASTAGAVIYIH
jgi:polysaccharide biosynthesis/export protein